MTDQSTRLEAATIKAEIGSGIVYKFSNDAASDPDITTLSGDIPNLKKVILRIQNEGAEKISFATKIFITTAAGIAGTSNQEIFLVQSSEPGEIYEVWQNVSGVAVDTGKRSISAAAVIEATEAATEAAASAQESADAATMRVARFLEPSATPPTQRDDGQPLEIGDRYLNTSDQIEYIYKSSGWVANNLDAQTLAEPSGAQRIGSTLSDGSASNVQESLDSKLDSEKLGSQDHGAFMIAKGLVSVSSISALSAIPEGNLRSDLRYVIDKSLYGPTSGHFKWSASSSVAPDGWSSIAHNSITGRFLRSSDGEFYLTGTPSVVLPASTATPDNAEWYPLDYVIDGNFVYTVVKGSYGGVIDSTSFEIWSFNSVGELVKKSALKVGTPGQDYRGIAKYGNFVYLCGFIDQSIVVVNVSDSSNPVVERKIPHQYPSGAQHATVANGMLLVSHWGGPALAAYSLAIPGTPNPIGFQIFSGESPFASSVLDGNGYLWQICWGTSKNVYCFDISVPYRKPVLVGSYSFSGLKECRYGQMYNGRLFLAEFQSQGGVDEYGVAEIDISNPLSPRLVVKHNCNAHTPLIYNDFIIGSMGGTPRKFSAYKMHGDGEVTEYKLNDDYHVYPKIARGKLISFRQKGLQKTMPDFVGYDIGMPDDVLNSTVDAKSVHAESSGNNGFKHVNGIRARDTLLFGDGSSTLIINPSTMPISYGTNTTLIGNNCGPQLNGGASNTFIGVSCGRNVVSGTFNTALGADAMTGSGGAARKNCTALGFNAQVTADNQVQLGDSATTTYVFGTVQNRSDLRDKADISPTSLGIDFVLGLRAVSGRWDYREDYSIVDEVGNTTYYEKDGTKKRERLHQWFIAQEVESLCAELGVEFGGLQHHANNDGEDVYSIGYDEFIPPLARAIQDCWARLDGLEERIKLLEGK